MIYYGHQFSTNWRDGSPQGLRTGGWMGSTSISKQASNQQSISPDGTVLEVSGGAGLLDRSIDR
jgi:hypothetical protein